MSENENEPENELEHRPTRNRRQPDRFYVVHETITRINTKAPRAKLSTYAHKLIVKFKKTIQDPVAADQLDPDEDIQTESPITCLRDVEKVIRTGMFKNFDNFMPSLSQYLDDYHAHWPRYSTDSINAAETRAKIKQVLEPFVGAPLIEVDPEIEILQEDYNRIRDKMEDYREKYIARKKKKYAPDQLDQRAISKLEQEITSLSIEQIEGLLPILQGYSTIEDDELSLDLFALPQTKLFEVRDYIASCRQTK